MDQQVEVDLQVHKLIDREEMPDLTPVEEVEEDLTIIQIIKVETEVQVL